MMKLKGIVFQHAKDDYSYWGDFKLTLNEQIVINDILLRHKNEGGSIRGTKADISSEIHKCL